MDLFNNLQFKSIYCNLISSHSTSNMFLQFFISMLQNSLKVFQYAPLECWNYENLFILIVIEGKASSSMVNALPPWRITKWYYRNLHQQDCWTRYWKKERMLYGRDIRNSGTLALKILCKNLPGALKALCGHPIEYLDSNCKLCWKGGNGEYWHYKRKKLISFF